MRVCKESETHLAWTVPQPAHLLLVSRELPVKLLYLHLYRGHSGVCLRVGPQTLVLPMLEDPKCD